MLINITAWLSKLAENLLIKIIIWLYAFVRFKAAWKQELEKGQSKALAEENLLTGRKGPTANKQRSFVGQTYKC